MTNQLIARYDIADYAQFRAEFDRDAEDRGNASLSVLQIWREGENRAWVLYQIADGKRASDSQSAWPAIGFALRQHGPGALRPRRAARARG